MTDATRLAALEAVVDELRKVDDHLDALRIIINDMPLSGARRDALVWLGSARGALDRTVGTIRALPSAPVLAGEVVTLAVWQYVDGDTELCKIGSTEDNREGRWTRLGTVTLPITKQS